MMLKKSFLQRIGLIEFGSIDSYYRMDVSLKMVDTQSGLVDFERDYKRNFKAQDFEIPSNSLSDNTVSIDKIKMFSSEISDEIATEVFVKTAHSAYTNVKSNILSDTNTGFNSREGITTTEGHPSNNSYLKKKRKDSFKKWIRDKVDF
jgi:hypothetical protein